MIHLIRLAMLIATTSLIQTVYAAEVSGGEQAEAPELREGETLTTIFPKELTLAQLRKIQADGYQMVSSVYHLNVGDQEHFDTVVPSGIKIVSNHLIKATRQTIDLTSTDIIDDETIATYTAHYTYKDLYDLGQHTYNFDLVCTVRFPINLETVTLKAQASRRGELTRRAVLPELQSYREMIHAASLTPELIATFKSLGLNYDFFAISIDSTENAMQYVAELNQLVTRMIDIYTHRKDQKTQKSLKTLKCYFDGIGQDKLKETQELIPESHVAEILDMIQVYTTLYQLDNPAPTKSDSIEDHLSPI